MFTSSITMQFCRYLRFLGTPLTNTIVMKNSSSDRIEYAKIRKVVFIIFLWYFLMSENEFLMLLKKTRSIYWYPIEFLIWNIRIRTFCIRKNENIHFLYIVSIFHSNIWYQNHLLIRRNIRYLIYKKNNIFLFLI